MNNIHDFEDRFYDVATVGERGQVVIPSKARKEMNIKAGDKLLVLRGPMENGVILFKISGINKMMGKLTSMLDKIGK